MMKNKKQNVFLSAASAILAVALVFAFVGCSDDDDFKAIGVISTMGAPSVKGMTFDTRAVATIFEAEALWGKLHSSMVSSSSVTTAIRNADKDVYDAAFSAAYSMTPYAYRVSKLGENKMSTSVRIDDSLKLAAAINAQTSTSTVTVATIQGSNKASASSNKTLGEIYYTRENGDNISDSTEANRTFNISGGYASWLVSGNTYKLSGIIKTEYKESNKETYKDSTFGKTTTESNSYDRRVAAALSFSDGDMGAIFRFSFALNGNGQSRSIKSGYPSNYSEIEVYDTTGNKIFVIDPTMVSLSNFLSFPAYFDYN